MVLLTIVANSNPHTLYFDYPIEKPSYIRLLSARFTIRGITEKKRQLSQQQLGLMEQLLKQTCFQDTLLSIV